MTPRFDPTRAVLFDFSRGQLRDEEGATRLNLPASLVLRLCEGAGEEATRDFAASLGAELGRKILARLGNEAESASLETWVEHLGGQLALLGLGNLEVERWGRALVLRVQGVAEELQGLVGVILEGALHRALGRELNLLGFSETEGAVYLAVSPDTVARVYELAGQGLGIGGVIEALHQGRSAGAEGGAA